MLRFSGFPLAAILLASLPALAEQSLGEPLGARDYPLTRGDNAQIGVPFDTVNGTFLAAEPCIEGFTAFTDEKNRGSYDKRLLQVSNTLGLMKTLNIDVSASAKVFGGDVSGKMGFAHSSSFNQTSLNYALYANYQGAPSQIKVKDGSDIRLTQQAHNLLKNKGEAKFREKCGDGYVSMIYTGAQAYAILSFTSTDQSQRDSFSSQVKAKAAGWSAEGSVSAAIEQQNASGNLEITYSQTGGSPAATIATDGTPVETEWSTLKALIDGLNQTTDTVNVGYQVLPYDTLISWKGKKLTPSPDLLKLAYYRAAYNTLLNTVAPLVDNPDKAEFHYVLGRNANDGAGTQDTLSTLQSDLRKNRTKVEQLYDACNGWTVGNKPPSCADTEALTTAVSTEAEDPYLLMARLPLKMASRTTPKEAFYDKPTLAKAIFDQYHVTAHNSYCRQQVQPGFTHPGCNGDLPTLRKAYLPVIENALSETWTPAPGLYQMKSLHRHDDTCLTAQTAKSDDQKLFMKTCAADAPKALQRFRWLPTGQFRIRDGACIAAPSKKGAHLSPHACHSKEGVQQWRFIPLDRNADASKTGGLLQEAGHGRCLLFGTPKAGAKTYVVTSDCDFGNDIQHWTYMAK